MEIILDESPRSDLLTSKMMPQIATTNVSIREFKEYDYIIINPGYTHRIIDANLDKVIETSYRYDNFDLDHNDGINHKILYNKFGKWVFKYNDENKIKEKLKKYKYEYTKSDIIVYYDDMDSTKKLVNKFEKSTGLEIELMWKFIKNDYP